MSHGADGGRPDTADVALVWDIWRLQLALLMMMNASHKRGKKNEKDTSPLPPPPNPLWFILWPQEMTFTDICFWVSQHFAVWHANEKKIYNK